MTISISKAPGTRLTVIGLVNENEDIFKDKFELLRVAPLLRLSSGAI